MDRAGRSLAADGFDRVVDLRQSERVRHHQLEREAMRGELMQRELHGAVIVAPDLVECFALAAYMEENAYRQYMAMQIGDPYVFSEDEQQAFRERLRTPALLKKTWDHYRSKL